MSKARRSHPNEPHEEDVACADEQIGVLREYFCLDRGDNGVKRLSEASDMMKLSPEKVDKTYRLRKRARASALCQRYSMPM